MHIYLKVVMWNIGHLVILLSIYLSIYPPTYLVYLSIDRSIYLSILYFEVYKYMYIYVVAVCDLIHVVSPNTNHNTVDTNDWKKPPSEQISKHAIGIIYAFYLPIYLSIYLSIYLNIFLSFFQTISLSVSLFIFLTIFLSIFLSIFLIILSCYSLLLFSLSFSPHSYSLPNIYHSLFFSFLFSHPPLFS